MSAEILIVDDDPMVGELTKDLLSDAGYGVSLIQDSSLVLAAVREQRPRLVLLDILMPGTDGLTLLHQLKADPDLSGIKVAVVSAKNFKAEIDRAKSYGADLFIRKPYDIQVFPAQVAELIGPPAGAGGVAAPKTAKPRARVWGRSEAADTPCLSVEDGERLFILDAGLGLTTLGERVLAEGRHKEAWLLLSHFHPDHVGGLGLFPPLRQAGFTLRVLGPAEPGKGPSQHLKEAIELSFKKDRRPIAAKISVHELKEDSYELAPGLRVQAFYLNHPGTTLGYQLQLAGKRLAYCPDAELYGEAATALQDYDERTARACRGADLLVHDGRWLKKDLEAHRNEGHSTAAAAGAFAADCEAGRLWLWHADAGYGPEERRRLLAEARSEMEAKGVDIPCELAEEGLELEF